MKQKRKKRSLMDQLTGIVLVVFAVGVLVMVAVVIREKMPKKEASEPVATAAASDSAVSGSATDEEVDERYLTVYKSESSGKSKDYKGSVFSLELNEKNSTYKEYLVAGGERSEIDHGTFERTEEGIRTVNRNDKKNKLLFDEEYLVSETALFEGEVPEGKTFDKTFINKAEGESEVRLEFSESGNFYQSIMKNDASIDGSDMEKESEGTYERKGDFINRTNKDGTKMRPIYIYKNKICVTYYQLEKEATMKN